MDSKDKQVLNNWKDKWTEFLEKQKNSSDEDILKHFNALLGAFPYVNLFDASEEMIVIAVITYRVEYALYQIYNKCLDDDTPSMSWVEFYHIIENEEKLKTAARAVIIDAIRHFNWTEFDFGGPKVEVEFPPEIVSDDGMIYMSALYPEEERASLAAFLSFQAEKYHYSMVNNKSSSKTVTWQEYLEKTLSDEKQAQMLRDAVCTCVAKLDFAGSWLSDGIEETKFLWGPPTMTE